MDMELVIHGDGLSLSAPEEAQIRRRFVGLERRLQNHPEPKAIVTLGHSIPQRRFSVDLRVELGPLGPQLISHESAPTLLAAVRMTVSDVERQLERRHAEQRGEPS